MHAYTCAAELRVNPAVASDVADVVVLSLHFNFLFFPVDNWCAGRPYLLSRLDWQVLQRGIPFMVILGEKEVQQGVVQLKDMTKHTQEVSWKHPLSET